MCQNVTTDNPNNFRPKSHNTGTSSADIIRIINYRTGFGPPKGPPPSPQPSYIVLAALLVYSPYGIRINFGEQRENPKKHVKCHNQNVKWLMRRRCSAAIAFSSCALPSPPPKSPVCHIRRTGPHSPQPPLRRRLGGPPSVFAVAQTRNHIRLRVILPALTSTAPSSALRLLFFLSRGILYADTPPSARRRDAAGARVHASGQYSLEARILLLLVLEKIDGREGADPLAIAIDWVQDPGSDIVPTVCTHTPPIFLSPFPSALRYIRLSRLGTFPTARIHHVRYLTTLHLAPSPRSPKLGGATRQEAQGEVAALARRRFACGAWGAACGFGCRLENGGEERSVRLWLAIAGCGGHAGRVAVRTGESGPDRKWRVFARRK
ncbi:hypothetical protein K438DRAFT_1936544 [Mycena galopus ATCC 62051]|nr:hypothetical protein K438DRAFT_1936544 [Mycena galopus ATCC 62051]